MATVSGGAAGGEGWTPLSCRPEWADVVPVAQDDGPDPPVRIDYAPRYAETLSYFRAVWLSGEVTARALALTAEVIGLNATHYTAWQHRRACVVALGASMEDELTFTQAVATDSPKNYQLWHHRRWALSRLAASATSPAPDVLAEGERAVTAAVLAEDAKNYHAWSHRLWAMTAFHGWGPELGFTHTLLAQDCRNNSAWNHRWNAWTRHMNGAEAGPPAARGEVDVASPPSTPSRLEAVVAEVAYVLAVLTRVTLNESAWSYLRALVKWIVGDAVVSGELTLGPATPPPTTTPAAAAQVAAFALPLRLDHPVLTRVLFQPITAMREAAEPTVNLFANEFMADAHLATAVAAATSAGTDGGHTATAWARARRLLAACAESDPVRTAYWRWRLDGLDGVAPPAAVAHAATHDDGP